MTAAEALSAARDILSGVTPLKRDCGRVCGAACCEPDEEGRGGMLLFPAEEALYRGAEGFKVTDCADLPGGRLVTCSGRCARDTRPLSCRFFPLWPDARGRAAMDRRALGTCPLCRYGLKGLDPAFVRAAEEAAAVLVAVPEHRAFLEAVERRVAESLKDTGLWEG